MDIRSSCPLRDALKAVTCNQVTGFYVLSTSGSGHPLPNGGPRPGQCNWTSSAKGVDCIPQVYPRRVGGAPCKNVCWDIDCPSLDLNLSFSWHSSHQETQPTLTQRVG
jgi:hypothetical protein